MKRRDFLMAAGGAFAGSAALVLKADEALANPNGPGDRQTELLTPPANCNPGSLQFGDSWKAERLNQVAFPMGGIGAGMICLDGVGAVERR